MDAEYITNHRVIDRYVLGQLSEQEQVEFELYYLENAEVLDEVDMMRALQQGLSEARQALGSEPAPASPANPSIFNTLAGWFQSPVILAGNFAIIAVMAAIIMLPGQQSAPVGYTAERVWVGEVRGGEKPLAIQLTTGSLVFDIDVVETGKYTVLLRSASGGVSAMATGVQSDANAVLVAFPSALFEDGIYTLEVSAEDQGTILERELRISGSTE